MKEKINGYVKEKRKEAIVRFLKKHIVGEIILLLIVIGLIALKLLKKEISLKLHIGIQDAKNRKKAYEDDGYDDDIEPLVEE